MQPLSFVLLAFATLIGSFSTPETVYYVGEMVVTDPDGAPLGSQVVFIAKTIDPDAATVTERAVFVRPTGEVEDYTVTFTVREDDTFSVSDATGTVDGEGQYYGERWAWSYFAATYRHRSGITVEDENTMADPSVITARKVLRMPDGSVFMYHDVTVKEITPATFDILVSRLTGG